MSGQIMKSWRGLKLSILVFPILVALFGAVIVAYAALYSINTNDGSISEWSSQSIPIFQTSPSNGAIDSSLDLKNMWVATSSGNTNDPNLITLNFRAEMYGTGALTPVNTAIAALLNCDGDTQINDRDDRLVVYIRDGGPTSYCPLPFYCISLPDDALYVYTGDLDAYILPGTSETQNHNLGQAVGNSIEWATEISALQGEESKPADYCQNNVGIRFTTATLDLDSSGNVVATIKDETTDFRGWNIPTAIDMQTFTARSQPSGESRPLLLVSGAGLLALGLASAWLRLRNPTL